MTSLRSYPFCSGLITLVLFAQAFLPGIHLACGHHQAHAVMVGISAASSATTPDDDADCPVCASLLASGLQTLPDPIPGPVVTSAATPLTIRYAVVAWAQAPPDVRWSSPRGPPAA